MLFGIVHHSACKSPWMLIIFILMDYFDVMFFSSLSQSFFTCKFYILLYNCVVCLNEKINGGHKLLDMVEI